MGKDTETKFYPYGPRENSPVEKQGNQDSNPDESGFRINTKPGRRRTTYVASVDRLGSTRFYNKDPKIPSKTLLTTD